MTVRELYTAADEAGFWLVPKTPPSPTRLPCPKCGRANRTYVVYDTNVISKRRSAKVACYCGRFMSDVFPVFRGRGSKLREDEAWNNSVIAQKARA